MSRLTQARSGFQKIFDEGKESVTVREVSFSRNEQDDPTASVVSENDTYAKLDRGGSEELFLKGGELGDADYAMYFPHSYTTGLSTGNYITYDSTNYKITRVAPYNLAGGLVFTKVFVKETNETF